MEVARWPGREQRLAFVACRPIADRRVVDGTRLRAAFTLQLVKAVAQTGRLHLQRQYRFRRHFSQLRIDHADAWIA